MNNKNSTKNKIIIVPNSELAESGKELKIVASDKSFYKKFMKYNFKVVICALVNKKPKKFGWDINSEANISHIKKNLIFSNQSKIKKIINYFYAIFKTFKVVKNHSFFYLFIPGNISLIYALFLILFNKKYGLYIRGDLFKNNFYFLYKFIIKKAAFSIATGNYLKERLKLLNQKISCVVPMIFTSRKDLCQERLIPIEKPIKYLFVGRPSKDKGIFELLEALKYLRLDNINFELQIVGDNDKLSNDNLKLLIKTNKLENQVNFSGSENNLEELKNIFKKSDVFVFPSHHEGFPRVVYEAMTFGLPMVLTNLPSYTHTLNHNIHCEFVEIQNSYSLYNGMKNVATNKDKYNSYSKNGLILMKNYYQFFEENKSHTDQVLKEFNK